MSDLEKLELDALEIHNTGSESYQQTLTQIPNIIRLSEVAKKIREKNDRLANPETEKDDIDEYLVDVQAKITIFRQLIAETKDSSYEETLIAINDWDELFQDLIYFYYKNNFEEFKKKVAERIGQLETNNPERKNQSYRDRLKKLLGSEKFKKLLTQKIKAESGKLGEVVTKEFVETANSLNTFKIIKRIEPEVSRTFKDKTYSLEAFDFGEIKEKISLKIKEAEKIKESNNPDISELKKIDQEIKILLAPILRKISLLYIPTERLKKSEGTTIHETLLKEQAMCGGSAEIIRLVTEYLGLKGRSIYYPGHVNYEIFLPSGDILLADNNGNFKINPQSGEAANQAAAKYYKTLKRVENLEELTEAEKSIVYRRLNSEGEIEYYLPEDGEAYRYLQFGRTSSQKAAVPQSIVNNLSNLFIGNNLENFEEGLMFMNQTRLENNPYGAEIQTSIEIQTGIAKTLSENSQKQIFENMLEIDIKTVFTCQNLVFIENQISKLPDKERKEFLIKGQKYLSELLTKDSEFFIFLNLYANLYLIEKMLLKFGIGNESELKTKIEQTIKIYEAEINKFPIEEGNNLNREYHEKTIKMKNKMEYLKEMLQNL